MGQYNRIAESIEGLSVFPERVKLKTNTAHNNKEHAEFE